MSVFYSSSKPYVACFYNEKKELKLTLFPQDLFEPITLNFDRDFFEEKTLFSSKAVRYKNTGTNYEISFSSARVDLDVLRLVLHDFVLESSDFDFLDIGDNISFYRKDIFYIVLYPYPVPVDIDLFRFDNFFQYKFLSMIDRGYSNQEAVDYFNQIITFNECQLFSALPTDYSFGLTNQTRLDFKFISQEFIFGGILKTLPYCEFDFFPYFSFYPYILIPKEDKIDYCPLIPPF